MKNILKIIQKRKNNQILTNEEISFIVENYSNSKINDQEMEQFLKTLLVNDINEQETLNFFKETYKLAKKIDLSKIDGFKIDKHSTGGIGDKTTIVLLPILESLGMKVYKFSGKHLGYTGGTIDKLNSFKNINLNLKNQKFLQECHKNNIVISEVNDDFSSFEKKLYFLRTKSKTTKIISLIANSVLIKKIILKNDALLIDLKIGHGSLFNCKEDAFNFAKITMKICQNYHRKITIVATDMEEPIGNTIGNKIEVLEAIKTLTGQSQKNDDLMEIINTLTYEAMLMKGEKISREKCRLKVQEIIKNGSALNNFKKMITNLNGDYQSIFTNPELKTKYVIEIKAWKNGYLSFIDVSKIGILLNQINQIDGKIDYETGIRLYKKTNQKVDQNEIIAKIYTNIENKKILNLKNWQEIFGIKETKKIKKESKIIKIFRS